MASKNSLEEIKITRIHGRIFNLNLFKCLFGIHVTMKIAVVSRDQRHVLVMGHLFFSRYYCLKSQSHLGLEGLKSRSRYLEILENRHVYGIFKVNLN